MKNNQHKLVLGRTVTTIALAACTALGHAQTLPAPPSSPSPVVNYEYDAQGHLTKTVQTPSTIGYDFTTRHTYDSLGRRDTTIDARGKTARFGYNAQDELTSVRDPRVLDTKYDRDGLANVTKLTSPDAGIADQTYDALGQIKTRTDARGVLATYGWDALNRLSSINYTQGTQSQLFTWTYDQTGTGFAYGIGRLTSTAHPTGTAQYTYDALGRLASAIQRVKSVSGGNPAQVNTTTSWQYNTAGHVTRMYYPSGVKLDLAYSGGLLRSISIARNSSATPVAILSNITYEPFGPANGWSWNMVAGPKPHTRVYDTNGRLVRYPLGNLIRDVSYDAADRISGYVHYDAATAQAQGSWNQSFSYDELGRLKNFVLPQTAATLGYDDNGNRSAISQSGVTRNYTTPTTSNRLTSISNPSRSLTYDAVGNTKTDGSATFTYDLAGRLATHLAAGVTTTYSYDNDGRRIRKHSSAGAAGTRIFVYGQQGELLGEYDSAGKPVQEYVWLGSTPIAIFTVDPTNTAAAPTVYYIHADHIDTPRVIVDRAGKQRWNWMNTDPWGLMQPDSNPSGLGVFTFNLRAPGQYADQESGLFYNHWRYYDPSTGRYISFDPIGLAGGSFSGYDYVNGNPLSYVDPEGLFVQFIPPVVEIASAVLARQAIPRAATAAAARQAATRTAAVGMAAATAALTQTSSERQCGGYLYRAMTPAPDGLPLVAPTARGLGVRPGIDIVADQNGTVFPGTGGMSVSPQIAGLPPHRLPSQYGGTGKDPVYCTCVADLPSSLSYRPDPTNPLRHGFVEPAGSMPLDAYQQSLGGTRSQWRIVP